MWVGIALVITMSGNYVTQASPFSTKQECVAATSRIAEDAQKSERVLAFRLECVEDKALHFKPAPPLPKPESAERPRPKGPEYQL